MELFVKVFFWANVLSTVLNGAFALVRPKAETIFFAFTSAGISAWAAYLLWG